jgi:hypothetical protein
MKKKKLYEDLIERMEGAVTRGSDVEAAWYAYAVLEDRLRSMLRQSGGEAKKNKSKPIKMMGPKIEELKDRALNDRLLHSCFERGRLEKWKDARNDLVHAMADGKHDIQAIDALASALAIEGVELARLYASAARRLKKHRKKGR